jgi:fructose/tagatose bisphosphate aldolase
LGRYVETWRIVEIQILEEIDFETPIPIVFHGSGIKVSDWCALCRVYENSEVQWLEVIDLIV